MLTETHYITDNKIYTWVGLPGSGTYPVYIERSPYVDDAVGVDDGELEVKYAEKYASWCDAGFAVVFQHCRGRGKSGGHCIPYINEREDGLLLHDWIRSQSFYEGKLYLGGGSYCSTVHYVTQPFAPDIKGAVLRIQDPERYNLCYRNGNFKIGLHGDWYMRMYKRNSMPLKNYTRRTFETLPLKDFTQITFGEPVPSFDDMLRSPDPDAPFWQTLEGGSDARRGLKDSKIPILLTTGLYDIFTGGIFSQWFSLSDECRSRCALMVSANDHGDTHVPNSIDFPESKNSDKVPDYMLKWILYCDGRGDCPVETGKITYYRLFENKWHTDAFETGKPYTITLGDGVRNYVYNPYAPPSFPGGLSRNFGGAEFQPSANRYDIISLTSEPFENDTVVQGKMSARLKVRSDCEDTCFFIRVDIITDEGDFPLRDDITTLCRKTEGVPDNYHEIDGDYTPNEWKYLNFSFDEHSFLIKAGQRLRIDIASADALHFVRHTNNKGLFSEMTTARIAHNSVDLSESTLTLPVL